VEVIVLDNTDSTRHDFRRRIHVLHRLHDALRPVWRGDIGEQLDGEYDFRAVAGLDDNGFDDEDVADMDIRIRVQLHPVGADNVAEAGTRICEVERNEKKKKYVWELVWFMGQTYEMAIKG